MVPRCPAVRSFARVWLVMVLAAVVPGCGGSSASPSPGPTGDLASLQPGEIRQLDDFPLFVMRTSVDYGFDDYLRTAGGGGAAAARAAAIPRAAWACTCFSTAASGEGPLFGRNFDWRDRASLLLYATPPNALASLSMVDLAMAEVAGTVGLDQLRTQRDRLAQRAPYLPLDGVNERGVAVGLMAVPSAEPPFDPAKATLYDLALIRLVLDYASDTNQALELLRGHNYRVGAPPVHVLVADRGGVAALVEYVQGEMKVLRAAEPFMVATNFVVSGSQAPVSTGCWRYDRAYATLLARGGALSRAEALSLLASVSQDSTMWSAVYDLAGSAVEVVPGRRYGRAFRLVMDGR